MDVADPPGRQRFEHFYAVAWRDAVRWATALTGSRSAGEDVAQDAFARLAEGEGKTEADLLSYLLFDGRFTRELIDLGWHDAQRRHDEIVGFFGGLIDGRQPGSTTTVTQRKAKR